MPTAIIYREELKEYDFGQGHPFRGHRFGDFMKFFQSKMSLDNICRIVAAEPVKEEDLLKICDKDYIDFTTEYYREANLGAGYDSRFYDYPYMEFNREHSASRQVSEKRFQDYQSLDNRPQGKPGKLEEAARLIVGQSKLACDLVYSGEYPKAVSIGGGLHHAKRNYGEGFCLYNDVAFAGTYLTQTLGLKRVLILDTDAHGGNGTMEYFYDSPDVLFVDVHQDPATLYPGTGFASQIGSGEGKGYTVNIPLPMGAGDSAYMLVFDEIVEPVAAEFKPEIIIRNGGSDPHYADGLTNLGLTVKGFRMVGERVRKLAELCGGKEVDLITSGYNEEVLPYGWLSLLSGALGFGLELDESPGIPPPPPADAALEETRKAVAEVKRNLKDYWRCFR